MANNLTDKQTERVLKRLHEKRMYKGMRTVAGSAPKNLQSTGLPSLILSSDPNPNVISNEPKTRFSKPQKGFLKSCYWTYAVHDKKFLKSPVIMSFEEITGPYNEAKKYGTYNLKSSHSSMKRSARNLAQYGYCILSYDAPDRYNYWEETDPHNYQPMLVVEATILGIEKGRELIEADEEITDPNTLRENYAKMLVKWKAAKPELFKS